MKKTYSFPTLELESVTLKDVMCESTLTKNNIQMVTPPNDDDLTFE